MTIPKILIESIEADSRMYIDWLKKFEPCIERNLALIGPDKSPDYPVWPRNHDNFHYPLGMRKLLSLGFSGLRDISLSNSYKFDGNQRRYLHLIGDVYKTVTDTIDRFGILAKEQGCYEHSLICKTLAGSSPNTFIEACQLYWFATIFRIGTSCIGRIDQHLYPFYKADLDKGVIDHIRAREVVSEMLDRFEKRGEKKGDTLQNITLSGQNESGEDETNDLTYMILELCIEKNRVEPKINVRVSKKTPERLLDLVSGLQYNGTGICTIYNDDVIIAGLKKYQRSLLAASNYCADGCTEVILDGFGETAFRYVDCVKAVEHTLFNGGENLPEKKQLQYYSAVQDYVEVKPPVQEVFNSGDFENMERFEDFYNTYLSQLKFQVDCALKTPYNSDQLPMRLFTAATMPGVIENACEPYSNKECYHSYGLFIGSLGTAVNSIAAVKNLIYEKRSFRKQELISALKSNFEGYEIIRHLCKVSPKFGNDDDSVDILAADIAKRFCMWVRGYREKTGRPILPGLYNHLFHHTAYSVGATPDGRRFGDPVGEHLSPTPGTALKGPTAVINSICKVNTADSIYGSTLHFNLPLVSLKGVEEPRRVLKYLTETFCEKRGSVMNVNVLSTEILLDAQKNPEKYEDLIVRVWGFSYYFTRLSKEMQEHVISRSKLL